MHKILALTICLWIGFAYAQSKEDIQEPVPPIAAEAENSDKSENNRTDPKSDAPPSPPPVVVNVHAAEKNSAVTEGKQAHTNAEPTKWTDPIVVLTGLLVVATAGLIYVGYRQEQSTRTIERAYVKMSHVPPGLNIEKPSGTCWVTVQVKNYGRTPARITDVLLKSQLLPNDELLPEIPDYRRRREQEPPTAFLVTGDEFFYPDRFTISTASVSSVVDGTTKLWLFGYVDYIDKFGRRHRAGYARVYDPIQDNRSNYRSDEDFARRSNLVFVTQDGYNYDRPRKKDEGNDWNEKPASN